MGSEGRCVLGHILQKEGCIICKENQERYGERTRTSKLILDIPKKKVWLGWTFKLWREYFSYDKLGNHGEIRVPKIVKNKKWWLESNATKVRITIEEV